MKIKSALLLGCLLLIAAPFSHAQAPAAPSPFTASTYIQYPSLNPTTVIHMRVGTYGDAFYQIVSDLITKSGWDCANPANYKLAVIDKSAPPKELRQLQITAVRLIANDPATGKHYKTCKMVSEVGIQPVIVDLVIGSHVATGDLIQVTVYTGPDHAATAFLSDGKLSFTATNIPAFSATPQAAPGESLNNGTTRTVGQLSIAFSDLNLTGNRMLPVNVYARSTDLLSTDGKDTKSAVALTTGFQRGIWRNWYSPFHLEQTLQGNQTAKNLSTVTSLGAAADPPWSRTRPFLLNSVIAAPLPFEPSLAIQYTHRFEQLVTARTPKLSSDDLSINGSLSWDTITFPFACRILFWETSPTKTAKPSPGIEPNTGVDRNNGSTVAVVTTPVSLPVSSTSNCLGAEIDLGGWYLPLDLTTRGTRKAEGYGDVSILIPLSDFSVASRELTYVTKSDPTRFQIRIKYTDAVNQANNYARTRGWTFGIEALK